MKVIVTVIPHIIIHEEGDESDSSSEYSSLESDLYESDDEAIECGWGWKRVGDAFADKRPM